MKLLYNNPEVKSITTKFLIMSLVVMIFLFIFMKIEINNFKNLYIEQNTALAGKILSKHPSLKDELIPIFTKGASKEEISIGKLTLSKYNLNNYKDYIYEKPMDTYYKSLFLKSSLLSILILFVFYLIIICDYKNVFFKIRNISNAAEQIVNGNFNITLDENDEGDFSILNHHFHEMAKRLKNNIERLKKDKLFLKNIISDISHQLKTPLSSLILFNDMLLTRDNLDLNVKKDFLQKSSEQLSRMEWLIINLLKLARVEGGAITFNKIESPIYKTLEQSIAPLLIKADEKKQDIIINSDKDILLKHDTNWSAEALSNIIKNSIEHTPCNGMISITTDESPLYVQIFIKDTGIGISPNDLPKIFDRFYKSKTQSNPNSIGIGLSLSKAIIEGQGGNITVESSLNHGTEFCITFLKHII